MKELLDFLLKGISGSKNFVIEETSEEGRVGLNIKADDEIIGLIIGKNGKTIRAIRNLLRVRAALEKKGVFVSVSEKE